MNHPISGGDSSDDNVEMEIEDEENESVDHKKDNRKALKTQNMAESRNASQKRDVSNIEKIEEGSELKKWEINMKKMEDHLLESCVAGEGEQR